LHLDKTVAVLGAGSWGSALAIALAKNCGKVHLWGNNATQMQHIIDHNNNEPYVKGNLPENITAFSDFELALDGVSDVIIVVPTVAFLEVLEKLFSLRTTGWRIAWGTKGLVKISGENTLLPVAVQELYGDIPTAVLSGPSFAGEVAANLPTCVNLASNDSAFSDDLCALFASATFRVDSLDDMISVSLGGVIKNIFAILSGMSDGLGWGANARCALISWGYSEMSALLQVMGGSPKSLTQPACVGDLILTCTDDQSRNRRFGKIVGFGKSPSAALTEIGAAVEGYANVAPVYELARKHQLSTPVIDAAHSILMQGADARSTLAALFIN
jgi:glycerol-3-phosphate dehydrogenase (NAD(P)+)